MKSFLLLSLTCILLIGCSKDVVSNKPPVTNNSPALNPNTIVVGNDISTGDLIGIDSTHLTFNAGGAQVNKIKVGSILVGGISSLAKYGFLRSVQSVSNSNGQVVCVTTQASLVDAVNNCDITYSQPFTDNNIDSLTISKFNGGKLRSSTIITGKYSKSFTQSFDDIFYDADNNYATTYDQIAATGSLNLNATFNFLLSIGFAKVTKFKADISLSSIENLNLQAGITDANLSAESTVITYSMVPVVVDVVGVPLVIVPQINVVIGVDGKITALVTAGVQNTSTVDPGIEYENQTWTNTSTVSNTFVAQPIQFQGAASIKPYIQVQLEFRPYGIPNTNFYNSSFYIGAKAFLDGQASVTSTGLSSSLQWGYAFSGLAQLSIFDRTIVNYNPTFLQNEYPVWQSNGIAFPTLNNGSISAITQTSATFTDTVTSAGGGTITARGVCWSTSPDPTISSSKTSNGTGTGSYTSSLTGLTSNTNYYVRAYATNSAGTSYGNTILFNTSGVVIPPTVTDIDGNVYHTVTIGTQTWMVENLKVTHYANGDAINYSPDSNAWYSQTQGAYCWPSNNISNKSPYGALYNGYAAGDARGLCPIGWHIATATDWANLFAFLGGMSTGVGGKLKETGTAHWLTPNTGATNATGFTAVGGGYRTPLGQFVEVGEIEQWWSTGTTNSGDFYPFVLWDSDDYSATTTFFSSQVTTGFSIRLIKDN
jgi:uncharacterized protein (TIGR02145 family)